MARSPLSTLYLSHAIFNLILLLVKQSKDRQLHLLMLSRCVQQRKCILQLSKGCRKMQARIANRPAGEQPQHSRHRNLIQREQSHSKKKHPSRNKQSTANLKKRTNRKEKRLKQETSFADLFNSARDLVVNSKPAPEKATRVREKKATLGSSSNKFEQSTASREFKLKSKQYDNPNGEYFGSKISIKGRKNGRSKKRERDKDTLPLTKSLELKIRSLRRMESLHSSESESIKSDASEKELRRLKKMHSLERVHLMEEIIGIEEKIIRKKKRRA